MLFPISNSIKYVLTNEDEKEEDIVNQNLETVTTSQEDLDTGRGQFYNSGSDRSQTSTEYSLNPTEGITYYSRSVEESNDSVTMPHGTNLDGLDNNYTPSQTSPKQVSEGVNGYAKTFDDSVLPQSKTSDPILNPTDSVNVGGRHAGNNNHSETVVAEPTAPMERELQVYRQPNPNGHFYDYPSSQIAEEVQSQRPKHPVSCSFYVGDTSSQSEEESESSRKSHYDSSKDRSTSYLTNDNPNAERYNNPKPNERSIALSEEKFSETPTEKNIKTPKSDNIMSVEFFGVNENLNSTSDSSNGLNLYRRSGNNGINAADLLRNIEKPENGCEECDNSENKNSGFRCHILKNGKWIKTCQVNDKDTENSLLKEKNEQLVKNSRTINRWHYFIGVVLFIILVLILTLFILIYNKNPRTTPPDHHNYTAQCYETEAYY